MPSRPVTRRVGASPRDACPGSADRRSSAVVVRAVASPLPLMASPVRLVVILTGVTEPAVSIVIPAHNEEAVIAGNLRRLLDGSRPGEFDVIVVANACQDGTARAAATVEGVRVLDTEVPGKPNALRMGDAECATFPRIYLDADVRLDAGSVRALVAACAQPGVLACSPVPELDLTGAGPVARR